MDQADGLQRVLHADPHLRHCFLHQLHLHVLPLRSDHSPLCHGEMVMLAMMMVLVMALIVVMLFRRILIREYCIVEGEMMIGINQ